MNKKNVSKNAGSKQEEEFPLPVYSAKDDIYSREKKEAFEEESPEVKGSNDKGKSPGDNLDIPGAELDDKDEVIGEEDEENNYYSLGGDNHEALEEDNE